MEKWESEYVGPAHSYWSGYPLGQSGPWADDTMLHAAATHPAALSAMSFCRVDLPMKVQQHPHAGLHPHHSALPSQVYTPINSFEGVLELRKEKSRDAARSRRGKENYEFYELAKMLPLPGAITSQLDKASIIRLTISFLKLRDFCMHGDPSWQRDGPPSGKQVKGPQRNRRNTSITNVAMEIFETHQGTHILQSLDGFGFAISNDGRFLYISETVSIYLGLSQVEMTGSSIFDYIHTQDHQELADQFGLQPPQGLYSTPVSTPTQTTTASTGDDRSSSPTPPRPATPIPERGSVMNPNPSKGYDRCFCVRMKSTLTKRGVHVKCSGYRVVQIMCHMRPQFSFSGITRKHPPPLLGMVAIAIALPPPTLTELVIDNDMFVARLSPDLKFTYCEPRISDMMDISAEDLTNKCLYDYIHAEDLTKIRKAHCDLLSKGQVLTDYYRLMNKHGGYVWIQTCATVICNSKSNEDQNIIAINYVLSGIEYGGCVMDTNQLKVVSKMEPDQSDHSETEHNLSDKDDLKDQNQKSMGPGKARDGACGPRPTPPRSHKRKHPSTHTDHGIAGLDDTNPVSPIGGFDLLYSPPAKSSANGSGEQNPLVNGVYDLCGEADAARQAAERHKATGASTNNSRRKMKEPKKRKPNSDADMLDSHQGDVEMESSDCHGGSKELGVDMLGRNDKVHDNLGMEHQSGSGSVNIGSHAITSSRPGSVNSPLTTASPLEGGSGGCGGRSPRPEDLSIRGLPHAQGMHNSSPLLHSSAQTPPTRSLTPGGMVTSSMTSSNVDVLVEGWGDAGSGLSEVGGGVGGAVAGQSAGNATPGSSVRDLEEAMNKHLPALPSESDHIRASLAAAEYNLKKSTIQWVGPQPPHTGDLSASQLLRSIYANRETVIRTSVFNPRPTYYHNDNMQSTLLTPPGGSTGDVYKDPMNQGPPQLAQAKTPPVSYGGGLVGGYPPSPISVSMAAPTLNDAYAMTPPSSVSPQDKFSVSAFSDHSLHAAAAADAAQLRAYDGALNMPLKPQAYGPMPAHANTAHMATYDRSQYSSYYGGSFPGYNHTPTPAHYRDPARTGNAW